MKLVTMFVCRSYKNSMKDYKGKVEKNFCYKHEQKSKLGLLLSKNQGELKLGKLFFYQN